MKSLNLFLLLTILFFAACESSTETTTNDSDTVDHNDETNTQSTKLSFEVIKSDKAEIGSIIDAQIKILKEDGTLMQEIELQKSEEGVRGYVNGPESVSFNDYNFDGKMDVSIATGKDGNSMGDSYSIYLQNNDGVFTLNEAISKLSEGTYLEIEDGKLKTNGRSGAEDMGDTYYKVVDNVPVLIEE